MGISWIGMFGSVLTNEIFNIPSGYSNPSVKNTFKNSIASGIGTMGMLFILEQGELDVDGIFPK